MKYKQNDFLILLAEAQLNDSAIPNIQKLSQELGVSTASVREQLEVARSLGFVDVKTKRGIQKKPFSLTQPLTLAMQYGVKVEPQVFEQYSDLRRHIEISYWYDAVPLLTKPDLTRLQSFINLAFKKIQENPLIVPYNEHRDFHMAIYQPLHNPIVSSVLETYWELYRDSGLQFVADQEYLSTVWSQHQKILDAVAQREFEEGFNILISHMDLFKKANKPVLKQRFE